MQQLPPVACKTARLTLLALEHVFDLNLCFWVSLIQGGIWQGVSNLQRQVLICYCIVWPHDGAMLHPELIDCSRS